MSLSSAPAGSGDTSTAAATLASDTRSAPAGQPSAPFTPQPSGPPLTSQAQSPGADVIEVSKCYTNATKHSGGEMLIKARSSDPAARLLAYRPDGTLIGEVQNGGGSRYGGSVMPYQPYDPGTVTLKSSAGSSVSVPTTPFTAEN